MCVDEDKLGSGTEAQVYISPDLSDETWLLYKAKIKYFLLNNALYSSDLLYL